MKFIECVISSFILLLEMGLGVQWHIWPEGKYSNCLEFKDDSMSDKKFPMT